MTRRVGKNRWHLPSEFHRELHADPNCPYAKQSQNYRKILERPFSILITTITRLAFVKSSLYAKEIYVSLSDDYYLDYSLIPRKIGLQDIQVIFEEEEMEVSGYRRMRMYGNQNSDDESSIGWGEVSQDGKIIIPLLVALILLNAINSPVKLKLNIASRDAYLFPELLEEVEGFEYKNVGEEDNAIPKFFPLRAFSHSKRKLTSPSILKRIMRFYELDELTQNVGKKEEGKILLIVNSKMLSDLHKWKSVQLNESKESLSNQIKDEEINKNDWKEFVDFLNAFRDRLIQYNQDKPKVIMMVLNDIHKRKLSKNPWNRITIREGKFALYDEMDHYDSIIIYCRPDLFTQTVSSFAE